MNTKAKKFGGILFFTALIILSGTALSQQKTAVKSSVSNRQKQLVGTWRLHEVLEREKPEDVWTRPYGDYPQGYFIYDTTRRMSIQIMGSFDPVKFASGDDRKPTPEEAKTVYDRYVAYFGRYEIDETNRLIIYHVEGSLSPGYIRTDRKVPFEILGNRLIIGDQMTWRWTLSRVQ
jgi:hypothetical protein